MLENFTENAICPKTIKKIANPLKLSKLFILTFVFVSFIKSLIVHYYLGLFKIKITIHYELIFL